MEAGGDDGRYMRIRMSSIVGGACGKRNIQKMEAAVIHYASRIVSFLSYSVINVLRVCTFTAAGGTFSSMSRRVGTMFWPYSNASQSGITIYEAFMDAAIVLNTSIRRARAAKRSDMT